MIVAPPIRTGARIFLSCGQQPDEIELAHSVKTTIEGMDFDGCRFEVYLAKEVHAGAGAFEEIAKALADTSYYVFIDLKRQGLVDKEARVGDTSVVLGHRGSLFSHQELALALYLGIPILPLSESGLHPEGMLRYVMGNAIEFERGNLPVKVGEAIRKEVNEGRWHPMAQRKLSLSVAPRSVPVSFEAVSPPCDATYLHVRVANLTHRQTATNLRAYLRSWRKLPTGRMTRPGLVELKWRGVNAVTASIPASPSADSETANYKDFDAIFILHTRPTRAHVGLNLSNVDSGQAWNGYVIDGPGEFELTYEVHSDQFPVASVKLVLKIDEDVNGSTLSSPGTPGEEGRPEPFISATSGRSISVTSSRLSTSASPQPSGIAWVVPRGDQDYSSE